MQGGSHAWNKSGHLAFTGYPVGSLQVLENRSINEMDMGLVWYRCADNAHQSLCWKARISSRATRSFIV